jgi:O-antigen ligase/tetratricopeptide (TPR) repeat protein
LSKEGLSVGSIVFSLFVGLLIFTPLAFGTVEPWSIALMEAVTFCALLLFLFERMRNKETSLYEIPGIIPLLCFLVYILFQLIPLPSGIVAVISPETHGLYETTRSFDKPVQWMSLSINKKATIAEFLRILSYGAFYILTVQILTDRKLLKRTIAVLVVFASVLSLFAILQHILWNDKIFWLRELTMGGTPFGPYVNRNHYAGLMEMLFPLVLGLFLYYKPYVSYRSFREKIAELFNLQRTNIYILLGFAGVLIGTSVFLTLSRSGIVSLCLSMALFGFMVTVRGMSRRRGIIIMVVFLLIALSVGWFGWGPIFERFERIMDVEGNISEHRLQLWSDSGNIVRDFPATGTGFGSYINIYPKYRTIEGDAIADHAHNDYIELLCNGGVIAFLISLWFIVTVLYKSFKIYLQRHELYSVYIFLGCVAGIISILMHSTTDFNLHIGANGLYFAFLFGLAVSASNTRLREGLNKTYLRKRPFPIRIMVFVTAGFLLINVIFNSGIIAGKMHIAPLKDRAIDKSSPQDLIAMRERAYTASRFDPLEARYLYTIANIERLLKDHDAASYHYKMAVHRNPVDGEYLQRLGLVLSEEEKYDKAEQLLQAGVTYGASNPERYKRYALWLLARGKKEEGTRIMQQAISMEPKKTREYITLLVLNGLSDEDIFDALPERVEPHLLFADYLSQIGEKARAEHEYLNALQYMHYEDPVTPAYFYKVYHYYMRERHYDDALKIMRKAIEFLPENVGIRLTTGKLYEKLGIPYRAMEEYRKALDLDPKNKEAKKRIDMLTRT